MMPIWIIEPRDPLIVRDGKPFGPDPGVRAKSLDFPFPSTIAGGARNRYGVDGDGHFTRTEANVQQVLGLEVHGPLLIELPTTDDEPITWYGPAPADALLTDVDDGLRIMQVAPTTRPTGPFSNGPTDLLPIGARTKFPAKLSKHPPQFWKWKHLLAWLQYGLQATFFAEENAIDPAKLGVGKLPRDRRMHVSIEPNYQTALDGALFQTSGLSFTLPSRRRFGLALRTSAEFPSFSGGLAPLAGERRVVAWRQSDDAFPSCPCLPEVVEQIVANKACRALLVTPAIFDTGYRPASTGPLLTRTADVTITLRAALVPQPQIVSGWEIAANDFQGNPKPTRRLAPAGAVYYLQFDGTPEAIRSWVEHHWMQPISDQPIDRNDGFGLVIFGVWSGQPLAVEEIMA